MNNDINQKLFEEESSANTNSVRRGPPNRMNDLSYKDWMRFQKSFFRYSSDRVLVNECIEFFTKKIWPDGSLSKILIVGINGFFLNDISSGRSIDHFSNGESLDEYLLSLEQTSTSANTYDFIMIDLRSVVPGADELTHFILNYSSKIFKTIQNLLIPNRYCCVLANMGEINGKGFPIPWSIALSARGNLRLRDEKIGLIEPSNSVVYCLFMQSEKDERPANPILPNEVNVRNDTKLIPAWIIPKPPPRKRNEILHPAKYPETLIEQFIEIFTKPGDKVFDPMVGTGSTVIAAINTNRDGYGMDIVPEFTDIARKRIADKKAPQLFSEFESTSDAFIVDGDVMEIDEIPEFSQIKFNYVITSPPYWTMLSNPGNEGQKARRVKKLPLVYSENPKDLGNIQDYDEFINKLGLIYDKISDQLTDDGYLTVIVKNIKRDHILYPLAWDLMARLSRMRGKYEYIGTTLWCQDDISVKPFAVGIYWVSNIFHHYCLHFKKIR
ncbi:DNA methyltransferase [Chloroflexota bacterium]